MFHVGCQATFLSTVILHQHFPSNIISFLFYITLRFCYTSTHISLHCIGHHTYKGIALVDAYAIRLSVNVVI